MAKPTTLFPADSNHSRPTSFLSQDPNNPQTYFKAFNQFTHSEYFFPISVLAGIFAYKFFKSLKGPAPIKGSAYWAKPEQIRRAKELCLKQNASSDPLEISFRLGNIPLLDAVTSAITFGAPKTGKSFGILNQLIFENLLKGNPQCILDLQYPVQTSMFVAIAQEFGYAPEDIHLFVPGMPESGIWNICELAEDIKALEMSGLIQDNASEADVKKDDFFSPGVKFLLAGTMSICRHIEGLNNLIGCRAFLNIKDLVERLELHRDKLDLIDQWSNTMFDQFKASVDAPETAASLRAATQIFLSLFANKKIAPSIIGKTSFPLRLEGKKLLIIGAPPDLRRTTAPLLMALLSQVVEANAIPGRKDTLQIAIDEVFSVQYKRIISDVNENRKYGVYFNVAAQNLNQCKEKFGEAGMKNLLTGFGHKFWFNPRENDSARYLETSLGSKITRKTNYTYGTSGEKSNNSSTTTEVERKLYAMSDILKIPQGVMIAQTVGISTPTEEYIPWKVKVQPSKLYREMTKWATGQWEFTQKQLVKRSPQVSAEDVLRSTRFAAEALLPSFRDSGGQKSSEQILREEQERLKRQEELMRELA
jgi:type IV secretory pathway TraG/TraD family ATPase VirD4